MTKPYIVYNAQVDEFVRVKRVSDEDLSKIVESFSGFLGRKGVHISDYLKKVIQNFVVAHNKYELEECLESLYDCVTEIYPVLQVELVCKAVNSIEDGESPTIKPIKTLTQIQKIKKNIIAHLIGQDDALEECLNAVKLVSSGLEEFVSLFFIGPTGVGKTELARLLSKEYLGSPKKLLKINCGEYSNSHEYAKLIGSPPGYIGHNEKGILSERASESSEWVVLFDEVEKAHSKLLDLLLNLLDEGKLTDNRGAELDFSKSIFLFTSNVGLKGTLGRKQVGFGAEPLKYDEAKGEIQEHFEDKFNPEFRNRLDSVIHFRQLDKSDAVKIAQNQLKKLPVRRSKKLVDFVVKGGYSEEFGARNIKRFIKNNITVRIAEKILEGEEKGPYKISIGKENELTLEGNN